MEPDAALARDAQEMEENGDNYIVYSCVVEPCLKSKELQEAFGCVEPMEIVEKIFDVGEIPHIAVECIQASIYLKKEVLFKCTPTMKYSEELC